MSKFLPELIQCPECDDMDGVHPQYDSIDDVVYLSCDECGCCIIMSMDEFNQYHSERRSDR